MYARCLFCQGSLGRNEAIEAFPVGRRLAYDATRGRLWVVCRACERWNLTPLEERWEAIEAAERLYRDTRRRVATENVGLARVADGTELVRIGRPLRPEFAAWRYGDQFGRRRRRQFGLTAAAVATIGAVLWGGPAVGLYAGGTVSLLNLSYQAGIQWWMRRSVVARVPIDDAPEGTPSELRLARLHASRVRLLAAGVDDWALEVAHMGAGDRLRYGPAGLQHDTPAVTLRGESARRAAARILPHVNTWGGSSRTVRDAVSLLDGAATVDRLFIGVARDRAHEAALGALPAAVRLALEMAAHEEQERRMLEGELGELERAWREAEEIAAIADDLLVPGSVADRLRRLRGLA
ncbi:MAG: hypothetical protein ACXWZS_07685 [Gemmatirosa sp.]